MLTVFKELSVLTGPSGLEGAVADYIQKKAETLSLAAKRDPLGNVFVEKPGAKHTARPVVLTAYMDEPGMMIRSITEEGLFRFGLTGDTDVRTILGKTVLAGDRENRGVVGRKPIHLTSAQERQTMPKVDELYLDLGAEDRTQAEKLAEPGDYAVFTPEVLELGPPRPFGQSHGTQCGGRRAAEALGAGSSRGCDHGVHHPAAGGLPGRHGRGGSFAARSFNLSGPVRRRWGKAAEARQGAGAPHGG